MTRPIVAAVDGSEESLRAAEWAAREAVRCAAPLRIVSAPGLPPRMRDYHEPPATVANALRGIAARALADAVDRVNEVAAGLLVDTDLIDGPPAVAVRDSGAGARLLVVGARGVGGFAALVLGSVSRYAASRAQCPVAVVHEETDAVHREIVVGVRDPGDADAALGFAFEEAVLRGASVTVLHAMSWFPFAGPAAQEQEAAAALSGRHLKEALDEWRQKFPEVTVTQDVLRGHPAHLLASLSSRADMVVIGRHDRNGTPGSSAVRHSLLGHAHGPVVIVPSISPG
jgi:nucleotide-binding universal stress UspA family protein